MRITDRDTVQEITDLFCRLDPAADRGEVERSVLEFMASGFDLTTTKLDDGSFKHILTPKIDPRAAHVTDDRESKPL